MMKETGPLLNLIADSWSIGIHYINEDLHRSTEVHNVCVLQTTLKKCNETKGNLNFR